MNNKHSKFTINYGNITNTISVEENTDQKIVVNSTQGNIENTVTIMSDGRIYLDGNEVEYNTESDDNKNILEANDSQWWWLFFLTFVRTFHGSPSVIFLFPCFTVSWRYLVLQVHIY